MMPEMDGIEVLRLLGEQQCKARIVLMSGMDNRVIETAEKLAHTLGLSVVGHLQKPFPLPELKASSGGQQLRWKPGMFMEDPDCDSGRGIAQRVRTQRVRALLSAADQHRDRRMLQAWRLCPDGSILNWA